jgi:hypothetical protein
LESGFDAIVVAHGRFVRQRYPHAHSHSDPWSDPHANTNTNTNTDAHSHARPGMRRGSNLDCDRDLYWRSARAT